MSDELWYKDAIIYELHVRAFADSNGDGIGDFGGLASRLDYLKDLGVTAVWLLPFYPSPLRDGGYDISNYTGVHPDYGTKADFVRFLEEAHRRNLRVITELVINHTSTQHEWFDRSRRAPPGSVERDFYVWSEEPTRFAGARIIFKDFERSNWAWDPVANAYYWHRFYAHQPDLNFDNPAVRAAVFEVLDYWLELGVDGVRLDAVPYLFERDGTTCENLPETHAFLKELRAHVDARFEGRMLLAEANQWPTDAASYFGAGDECHMNFHFPLMPRLFMAVNAEDSFPIIDVLQQTPAIPENCQWATFLRNHDELTLEMVTEEDRDYMYRVYAPDQRARINLGIRRRLAPLLGDRRRVELLNALLFALPGTPVLYYGDEIGMGDNIYLGDRDGVRTPMQWSPDRNAGFSRANPQKLFLPLIVDPIFHYEAVNVESEQANPASLLWWMKYLIALRQSSRIFSRGALRMVETANSKVLAFVREWEGERVLFVANLSRFAQHANLLLTEYVGLEATEMLGRSRFPKIEAPHWGLALGPYNTYWFSLQGALPEATHGLPLAVEGPWWTVTEVARRPIEQRLLEFVKRQRWYRARSTAVLSASLREVTWVRVDGQRFLIVLLALDYGAAAPELYVVPLAFLGGARGRAFELTHAAAVVCSLTAVADDGQTEPGVIVDALNNPEFAQAVLTLLQAGEQIAGSEGAIVFRPRPELGAVVAAGSTAARTAELDQTNSVFFYGSQVFLKFLRSIDQGPSAEVEMMRALGDRGGPRLAPALLGTIEWVPVEGEVAVLAVASEMIGNSGMAWDLAFGAVQSFFDAALASTDEAPAQCGLLEASNVTMPKLLRDLAAQMPTQLELLAARTAQLHLTLSGCEGPDFEPVVFDVLHQQSLYQKARSLTVRTFAQLAKSMDSLDDASRVAAARVAAAVGRIDAQLRDITVGSFDATRIRAHGDLHLGQIMFTGDDFVFIDFEGEPARPLRERRYKRCPLRDVAGVLRSLDYVVQTALLHGHIRPDDVARLRPWADAWRAWHSSVFVERYLVELAPGRLLPDDRLQLRRLLRFYLLEKCVYEVGYEIAQRPAWLPIPLVGLLRLLDEPP